MPNTVKLLVLPGLFPEPGNDIKGIFDNKITDKELKQLIQIINKIIERKIK